MRVFCSILILASLCVAEDKKPNGKKTDPLKETIKEIKAAVAKKDANAMKAAFGRAEGLRENYGDKKYAGVAKAVAKGVAIKNPLLAKLAVECLGHLKVPGTTKLLGKLLHPPAKVPDKSLDLHKAAIVAAGNIRDAATLKTLEKLLGHANLSIANGAAEAIAKYTNLERKPKLALAGRLIATLGKLEKKAVKQKDDARTATENVAAAVVRTLTALTGKTDASKAADWAAWLKAEKKKKEDV